MKKKKTFLSLAVALFIAPLVFSAVSPKGKPVEVSAASTETKRVWLMPYYVSTWMDAGAITKIYCWKDPSKPHSPWPGDQMNRDPNNLHDGKALFYFDVELDIEWVIFIRVNPSTNETWTQTINIFGEFNNSKYEVWNDKEGNNHKGVWVPFTPNTTKVVEDFAASIAADTEICNSEAVVAAVNAYNNLSTYEQNQFNALQVGDGFTGAQRLAYLKAFYNITTPLNVVEKTKNDDNSLMATIIIGVIGLSTLAGYYFLQRKKAVHD